MADAVEGVQAAADRDAVDAGRGGAHAAGLTGGRPGLGIRPLALRRPAEQLDAGRQVPL